MTTKLVYEMMPRSSFGLVTMCIGGGQGWQQFLNVANAKIDYNLSILTA